MRSVPGIFSGLVGYRVTPSPVMLAKSRFALVLDVRRPVPPCREAAAPGWELGAEFVTRPAEPGQPLMNDRSLRKASSRRSVTPSWVESNRNQSDPEGSDS